MSTPFSAPNTDRNDERGVLRDKWNRYLLPPFEGAGKVKAGVKPVPYTRATTWAKSISDTFTLSQWSSRMAVKGLAMRPDLYALAASTPLESRDALNRIVEDAKAAAGAKTPAGLGQALHSFAEAVDLGEEPVIPAPWDADITAYRELLTATGITFDSAHIERIVVIDELGVAGTFDRIATLTKDLTVKLPSGAVRVRAGQQVVADLKTGRDLTYGWNEISIQLALYAHGGAMWNEPELTYEPMPPVRRDVALVVHLPVGKAKAELIGVDLTAGWEASRLCGRVREWRKTRGLSAAIVVHDTETRAPTWAERVAAATTRTELSAIWAQASARGEWTPELTAAGRDQLSKVDTP